MAYIWYGHFDSTEEDPRLLMADDWARFIRAWLGDGIRNGGANLQVSTANSGMNLRIATGIAHIQGYIFEVIEDTDGQYYSVLADDAHPTLNRIDRLVLRLDRTIQSRFIEPVMVLGQAAGIPVPPALTRNANVWEISLAQVRIPAGAINIQSAYITDERLDSNVCGIINSLITADTAQMYQDFQAAFAAALLDMSQEFQGDMTDYGNQFQDFYDEQQDKAADIDNWYNTVKVDIAKLQTYDFDNIAALNGVTRTTEFNDGGSITETIVMTQNGQSVATRTTEFNENGTITVDLTVYDDDGETVLKQSETTTTFNENGSIAEVVI